MCRSLTQLLIVSFNGMLVNKYSTPTLALYNGLSYVVISLAKVKESFTVNPLRLNDSSIGIKN